MWQESLSVQGGGEKEDRLLLGGNSTSSHVKNISRLSHTQGISHRLWGGGSFYVESASSSRPGNLWSDLKKNFAGEKKPACKGRGNSASRASHAISREFNLAVRGKGEMPRT